MKEERKDVKREIYGREPDAKESVLLKNGSTCLVGIGGRLIFCRDQARLVWLLLESS